MPITKHTQKHKRQNHQNLKTKQTKNTFLPRSKTSHYFSWIFCFFNIPIFTATAVFCWKRYKYSVFRRTQLFKNTVSKNSFNPSKKHLSKKSVIFGFRQFPLKPLILEFFLVLTVLGQKILAKTDSVHEKARFSPFLTRNFCLNPVFCFFLFSVSFSAT